MDKVPVHVAKDLTPAQIRAYRIADNKTGELAEWNLDLLPIELAELQDAGIDWSLHGFDADELASLLDPGVKQGRPIPMTCPSRRAYLMELDPLYCDVIVQRWEKFTGKKAEWHNRKRAVSCPELR